MWFMIKIRNNKDLLTLESLWLFKFKIFFICFKFIYIRFWLILIIANPITSSMVKYYEKTKSNYARDIDHLVTFNNNGLWIKKKIYEKKGERIITAKPEKFSLNRCYDFSFE